MSILIHGARRPGHPDPAFWVTIDSPFIAETGFGTPPQGVFERVIDAQGAWLLPGAIDCHVHFREPGLTHKATIASETRAAAAGGVTSFLDMPNTKPATVYISQWEAKCDIARRDSLINYGFFLGATTSNINDLVAADYTRIPGVKVFMGSSTGGMLVDDKKVLKEIFSKVDALIAVHCENQKVIDENIRQAGALLELLPVEYHSLIRNADACVTSTALAVELARSHNRRLHICHITTARELGFLDHQSTPIAERLITSEVSPHHLLWTTRDYPRQGTRIKMNPAVKYPADRAALRAALASGVIDMVATDHAPHTLEEKQAAPLAAPSGAPMVQFALPTLLSMFPIDTVERAYCTAPAKVFRIDRRGRIEPGFYADLTLVREVEPYTVADSDVISLCRWTPMAGSELRHRVEATIVNGHQVYPFTDNDRPAMALRFGKTDTFS